MPKITTTVLSLLLGRSPQPLPPPPLLQLFPVFQYAAAAVDTDYVNRPTVALARPASPESTVPKDVAPEHGVRTANTDATVKTIRCATANQVTVGVRMDGSGTTVRHRVPVDSMGPCARANVTAIPANVTRKVVNV